MYKTSVSIVFVVCGLLSWLWPNFNGILFEPSIVSVGEGRIVGALFLVGAAIIY